MGEKIKVIFFIYELGAGGAARTIVNIVNHMNRTTFEPIVVTLNYEGSYEKYVKDDIRIIKLPATRLRSAIKPFSQLIKKENPELIFSTIPNYNTIAIISTVLARTKAKNVVREAAYLGGSFTENLRLRFYGLLYRFVPTVVALSEGVKENIVKRYGVPARKIEVVYNPIDIKKIEKLACENTMPIEHEAIFSNGRKTIVSAGRLVVEKDQETLLRAFTIVNEQIPSDLFLLGKGPLKDKLIALAKDLNIEKHVHFIGFQTNPYQYFKRADVFALSSTTEGFGHVLVEALATETLVVSTDCKPGSTEVLQDGKYGFVSPVGDKRKLADNIITALSLSKEDKEKRILAGKERANYFSAETIVKHYEQVFRKTIGVDET